MQPKAEGDLHGLLETRLYPATPWQPSAPRQAVARLVTHAMLAYFAKPPCPGCQHGTGKAIQGETAAAEVPEHLQKVGYFSSY